MGEVSGAEALDNWQQQLEEVTALQAICGDDFSVLAEGFGGGDDVAAMPSEELAAAPPVEPLECQAAVHVEVPQEGLALQVGWSAHDACWHSAQMTVFKFVWGLTSATLLRADLCNDAT